MSTLTGPAGTLTWFGPPGARTYKVTCRCGWQTKGAKREVEAAHTAHLEDCYTRSIP